jgi:vacuolar-type H+-ATPase subunit I/STV1
LSTLTKTFIVLTLVFSLALAVLMVLEVGRIAPYKEQLTASDARAAAATVALSVERTHLAALQTQAAQAQSELQDKVTSLTQQINALNAAQARLEIQNGTMEQRNAQLTNANTQATAVISSMKDQTTELLKEIATIRPQITDLIAKNAELNRVNNELSTQNRFAEQAIRKLQEAIVNAGNNGGNGAGAAINTTGGQVTQVDNATSTGTPASATNVPNRPAINGKITDIRQAAGHTLIETPLGSTSQVKPGTRFTIYRNTGARPTWIADAVVSTVTDDASVATITDTNPGQTPQAGDLVMSASGAPAAGGTANNR